ncbi:MAG: DNA polymerase Y family protein, partial [Acidimicrobiales bacterium]
MNHPAGTIIDQPVRSLVVWCPDWPVVAAGITPDVSAAVFHANRVVAASTAARAEGVTVDLRRREAQGRCPKLLVLDRDEATEASAFEAVAQAIEAFTPRLEILCPGTVATGTRGPSRYFGGDEALAGKVVDAVDGVLGERGTCSVGIADGTFAALQAARQAAAHPAPPNFVMVVPPGVTPQFLAPLPTACLERPELVDVWGRLGLRTLGAVAGLSLADVVGRFGAEGAVAHRLASGLDERPPDLRDPPPDLVVGTELDPPVERVDQVAFVAKVLADQLTEQLDRRGMACTRLAVEAETDHGEQLVRLWRHDGALSAGAIADRVRWQLDGWLSGSVGGPGEQGGGGTEAWARRPTGPVKRLVLRPDEVGPATGRQ